MLLTQCFSPQRCHDGQERGSGTMSISSTQAAELRVSAVAPLRSLGHLGVTLLLFSHPQCPANPLGLPASSLSPSPHPRPGQARPAAAPAWALFQSPRWSPCLHSHFPIDHCPPDQQSPVKTCQVTSLSCLKPVRASCCLQSSMQAPWQGRQGSVRSLLLLQLPPLLPSQLTSILLF